MKKILPIVIALLIVTATSVFAQSTVDLRVTRPAEHKVAKRVVQLLAESEDQDGDRAVFEWAQSNLSATDFAPSIYGVANAASYAEDQLNKIAPDQIVAIFGVGMTTNTGYAQTLPLTDELVGVSVYVQHPLTGRRIRARLFFVSPSQINLAIPSELLDGLHTLSGEPTTTIFVEQPSANKYCQKAVSVRRTNGGIFSANSSGRGLPAGLVLRVINGQHVYEAITHGKSIVVGAEPTFLVLFGTGLRHAADGTTVATIGGVSVPVMYAGPQGSGAQAFAGLDQVNIALPRALNGRATVSLAVTVDGRAANVLDLRF